MDNKQKAIDYIKTIKELSEEEQLIFIKKIENGGEPFMVLGEIEDAMQDKINDIFKKGGVDVDENDPEYKAIHEEMINEISSAEKEFNEAMSDIEKEINQIQVDAEKELDEIRIKELEEKIKSS